MSCSKAAIVNISTVLGSIEKTPETFSFVPVVSYRCSKAALNMLTKCQSMGYKQDGILCSALHPGWVKTELGSAQVGGLMTFQVNMQVTTPPSREIVLGMMGMLLHFLLLSLTKPTHLNPLAAAQ
uniref:C-factor n=1 Tax=Chrysemys picta bellii TaxID=8478 RepID=A0A8C3F8K7_CHRPI